MVLFALYLPSILSTLVPLFLVLVLYLETALLPVFTAMVCLPWGTAAWHCLAYLLETLGGP